MNDKDKLRILECFIKKNRILWLRVDDSIKDFSRADQHYIKSLLKRK